MTPKKKKKNRKQNKKPSPDKFAREKKTSRGAASGTYRGLILKKPVAQRHAQTVTVRKSVALGRRRDAARDARASISVAQLSRLLRPATYGTVIGDVVDDGDVRTRTPARCDLPGGPSGGRRAARHPPVHARITIVSFVVIVLWPPNSF